MSLVWFLLLAWMYQNGTEVTELAFIMISIFYIGDCIIYTGKKIRRCEVYDR